MTLLPRNGHSVGSVPFSIVFELHYFLSGWVDLLGQVKWKIMRVIFSIQFEICAHRLQWIFKSNCVIKSGENPE
jgi:hypothetical protein